MLFQSSRVYLRKMTADDIPVYHAWRNDVEVMRTTSPMMEVYSMEDTRSFVEHVILNSNGSKSFMVVDHDTRRTIGITSLINMDYKNRNSECIIDIGEKEFWGKGYGKEALKLLLDYAFLELNLHRVSLRVFSFNVKAIKLYDKIGFKPEGISRQALFREGTWHDIIHMGLLQEEYRNGT